MRLTKTIRPDMAASALAHLALLGLVLLVSEVRPFQSQPPSSVAVDLVSPEELSPREKEPTANPEQPVPDVTEVTRQERLNSPASAESSNGGPPPGTASEAASQSVTKPPHAAGFAPPEPDVSVKYGVLLGLPQGLVGTVLSAEKPEDKADDGGDANAPSAADLSLRAIGEFRRHLRACSKLPAAIAPADQVMIKLRAVMTTDGLLARPPILIEASASAKGPLLMQAAIRALKACQPYTMLPADRYQDWKVLDLTFTPRDFSGS